MEFNATFLVSIVSFIVFIIIMNTIFYKPILKIIEGREEFINRNYNDAENSKEETQVLINKRETILTQALTESRKIISDTVNNANEKSKNLTDDAKLASSQKINITKTQLQEQEKEISKALSIQDIAQSISNKVLGVEIKND